MRGRLALLSVISFVCATLLMWTQAGGLEFPEGTAVIGVIQDGPSELLNDLTKQIETDTRKLLGESKPIAFKPVTPETPWERHSLLEALERALDDSEIDVILGVGLLINRIAENPNYPFKKPVVTSYMQRSELATLPIDKEGHSTKQNYIFSVVNMPLTRDIKSFKELSGFGTLTALIDENIAEHLIDLEKSVRELERREGIKVKLVTAGSSADEALRKLRRGTQAVMLTPMHGMSSAEYQKLIDGINRSGIPSFSTMGYPDVERGVMAGLVPDLVMQTARNAAIHLEQAVRGKNLQELPVLMPVNASLVVNAKTANKVRFNPTLMTIRSANFIEGSVLKSGEKIRLNQAIVRGGQQNIDLAIETALIKRTQQESLIRRSPLLPQALGSLSYTQIDRDRAAISGGSVPQRDSTANIGLSQLIFDDQTLAEYRSSKREVQAAKLRHESVRLDSMEESGIRFAELLAAQALLRIAWLNLDLTLNQLEIAQLRYDVGTGGLDEVYRWQVQENQQRAELFDRYAAVQRTMVALNQSLNADQRKLWNPKDMTYDQVQKYFVGGRLLNVKLVKTLDVIEVFLVEEALKNSPELQELGKQAEAEGITLNQKKRKFYVPTMDSDFLYQREIESLRPGAPPTTVFDNRWQLGLNLSLPLFQGGRRVHEVGRSKAQLRRIEAQAIRAQQLIEQRTLSTYYQSQSSFFNLDFTKKAAESAKANFDIVQLKYSEGLVGILDMLDAQNEYILRSQAAALAIYDHLINLIKLQRALAWFEVDKTVKQKKDWNQELTRFFRS